MVAPDPEPVPVVRMRGIGKTFPGVVALDRVDLDLYPGEVHALTGENGSGKSTLAKVLYGGHRPDAGTVEVDGERVEFHSPADALAKGIVGISQELTLAPTLSVAENIAMGTLPVGRFGRVDWDRIRSSAQEALARLGVELDVTERVDRLSIELQQQVEIARAVYASSRVLVLDEATSSLSERATEALLAIIEQFRADGVAIVFISHRLAEVYQIAQKATVLRDGERVAVLPIPSSPESALVRNMVGRDLHDLYGDRTASKGETRLQVRGLATPDGKLKPTDLDVSAGEILGVAGLVGSGKADIGFALGGAIPSVGEVRVDGRPADVSSPRRAIASGLAFVSDDRKRDGILPTRSVEENLSLPWLLHLQRYGLVLDIGEERRMADETIERFGITTSSSHAKVTTLSGGNQQKVILGRTFALDPSVLVLSEPTRGIDVGAKSEVYGFIHEMTKLGKAIIMISSELPELLGVANRIVVLYRGELKAEFDATETSEEAIAHVAVGADESSSAAGAAAPGTASA